MTQNEKKWHDYSPAFFTDKAHNLLSEATKEVWESYIDSGNKSIEEHIQHIEKSIEKMQEAALHLAKARVMFDILDEHETHETVLAYCGQCGNPTDADHSKDGICNFCRFFDGDYPEEEVPDKGVKELHLSHDEHQALADVLFGIKRRHNI